MNDRYPTRADVNRTGLPLLALLLLGSALAALLPQALLAQGGRQDLSLRMVSHSSYAEITAGESKVFLMEAHNTGTEALRDVEFSALHPEGWRVTIEPDRIPSLNRSDSVVVEVTVHTPQTTTRERQEIILRADSSTVHRATSLWIAVEAREGRWLWVGGVVAAVTIAAFVLIFLRFGRD